MVWFKKIIVISVAVVLVLSLQDCVKYSFKGALPSYLKTIYIPLFEDQTAWPGLQEEITNKVVDAFIQDNTLKLVNSEENADLILKGKVVSIDEERAAITQQEVVKEIKLWVNVQVECINTHTNKPLWKSRVRNFGIISGAGNLDERNAAISEAVNEIVLDILNNTIAAW